MRVRIPALKGNPALAEQVRGALMAAPGVAAACASTLTGSVVINHDPARVGTKDLLAVLAGRGYIDEARTASMDDYFQAQASRAGKFLARTLTGVLMEQALAGTPVSFLFLLL